jgi:hypothetical protein
MYNERNEDHMQVKNGEQENDIKPEYIAGVRTNENHRVFWQPDRHPRIGRHCQIPG